MSSELQIEKEDIALDILKKVGAIIECCGEDKSAHDAAALEKAYAYGNSLITKKDKTIADVFGDDRRKLSDTIKSVYENANWQCRCERIMEDDG